MKKTKSEVIKLISKILSGLTIEERIPNRESTDKSTVRETVRCFAKGIIDEELVEEVIWSHTFKETLEKIPHNERNISGGLSKFQSIDKNSLATSVYTTLASLPKDYYFIFKLPKSTTAIPTKKILYGTEILSLSGKEFARYQSKKESRDLLLDMASGRTPQLSEGDIVLRVKRRGYVDEYGLIKTTGVDPVYLLKVVLGIYISLGVIKRSSDTNFRILIEYNYYVFDKNNLLVRSLREASDNASYLIRMAFSPEHFELTKLDKIMKKTKTRFDEATEIITKLFSKPVSKHPKDKEIAARYQRQVKNGSFWFYEMLKAQEYHVKVIYMVTAFDSLVGVKSLNKEEKAVLIANLIGRNTVELEVIKEEIINIYTLRNNIVHGEKEIFTIDKYSRKGSLNIAFYKASWILSRFLFNRVNFVGLGLPETKKVKK